MEIIHNNSNSTEQENIVWHYTSIDKACNILKGGNMHATYYGCFDDPKDVKYGFEIAQKILRDNNHKDPMYDDFLQICQSIIEHNFINLWYVISFTRNRDSSEHWEKFTDNVTGGCALGFEKDKLEDLLGCSECQDKLKVLSKLSECQGNNLHIYPPIECIYSKEEIKLKLSEIIQKYHNELPEIKPFRNILGAGNPFDPYTGAYSACFRAELARIALGAKRKSYIKEKELRLVFEGDDGHKPTSDNGNPKKHIVCRFNPDALSAIKWIMIAPHGNIQENRDKIEAILKQNLGYNFKVLNSKPQLDNSSTKKKHIRTS